MKRAAAQISGAHGSGVDGTFHLAECFDLHGAGKGDQGRCDDVVAAGGDQAGGGKEQRLQQNDILPPVQDAVCRIASDEIGEDYADDKGKNRDRIRENSFPVIFHKIHGKKNEISGLTVGKDAVSGKEGIGFEEAADAGEQQSDRK